jgi:hypothetical protein
MVWVPLEVRVRASVELDVQGAVLTVAPPASMMVKARQPIVLFA